MSDRAKSKSAELRSRLTHPVIDSDGHTVEAMAVFLDYLKAVAGSRAVARFPAALEDTFGDPRWLKSSVAERRDLRKLKPTWWANAARNTLDIATATMPKLMHQRLDEMGLDVSVVYPTIALVTVEIPDEEIRRASARALNQMKADLFGEFSDRLIAAATIPMHTPAEAIEEIQFAVNEAKLKAAMVASYVRRPIPKVAREIPAAAKYTYWMDTFGLDSEYDYDPFWSKCVELGIAPTFHSVGYGWGARTSISNYVHNHIGNFAASAEAICKGLFLGGVPQRFPKLRCGFLEGGVAWARSLYCELIGHWEKRNLEAVQHYNPLNTNRKLFAELLDRYGTGALRGGADRILGRANYAGFGAGDSSQIDEWAQSGVRSREDIRDVFRDQFYFGCEGDDPLTMMAYRPMGTPFNLQLNAFYGSDIGHWDVPDMSQCLEETYELVEHELMSADELRAFVCSTPIEFWTATNPDFFKGTPIEAEAAKFLARK
jgi:predicted TIM-barrel fold metal-dependent hydrolase